MADKFSLKERIQTFHSIDSLTYSMQIVSIIKLKKILNLITSNRPLSYSVEQIMKMVICNKLKQGEDTTKEKKHLVITILSNRGFCGDFNGEIRKILAKNFHKKSENHTYFFIGKKGKEVFKPNLYNDSHYFSLFSDSSDPKDAGEAAGEISLKKLNLLVQEIIQLVKENKVTSISLAYNAFESILRQKATLKNLFPLQPGKEDYELAEKFIFEPQINEDIFINYLSDYLTTVLYLHILESEAGEMGARFIMMKNATDSCKKSITELTLELNKIRQAGITKDLSEIVSGFKVLRKERG
ncbi:MAG TPA: hypothetical protein DF296_06030 [Candidatus Margulisbacteria bacterium]|nr:MAG: hypothetical protein A2X43_05990 [Candidatus Margulisbacteria bacterium GWD2_39_127]OGI02670.1 MAG: hypothetical protein A2X42_00295 [Candidatus Margulisbacteria bacterium GWF2_38_17]OGI05945.1 MAG: hypothetical protein A2X41_07690 [Candidatus Margulisbacteria bacterium GWE2_39_32]HAR62594.1 hypothetical protein [Candidatus Margulisiibacteriota bacterium]HCT84741.1 hypothetical protein [Candidatus Margulisiibacteriota bacterium]